MRIGELARRTGVSVRALRYYEEQGLLDPERSRSGQRLYPESAVEKVVFFQDMYAAGLSSRRIVELLPCVDTGLTDEAQRRMLHAERDRIGETVDRLRTALRRLDEVIEVAETRAAAAAR